MFIIYLIGANIKHLEFLPNFTHNPDLNMNDYIRTSIDKDKDIIINYHNEVPYEYKDFKVDIDYMQNRDSDLQENYKPISNHEHRLLKKVNRDIMTLR